MPPVNSFDKGKFNWYYIAMLHDLVTGIVDLFYPKICLSCKVKLDRAHVDNLVCKKCWADIKRNLPPFCHSCGRRLEKNNFPKNICLVCLKRNHSFDRAFSPCIYEGVVKELIHSFKYKGKDYLGAPLSRLMIEFIKEYNLPIKYIDSIIPVPLHKSKLREREFNQAEILSKHIADEFGKPVLKNILMRHRFTKTQTELEIVERLSNIKGSFSVIKSEEVNGRNLLLVDDVLTTGATASEAAYTLKNAGANIVFVLTLAN